MNSRVAKRKREILMELQDGKCCYCLRNMTKHAGDGGKCLDTDATLEHLDSRISGKRGTHGWGVRRVLLACYRCNREKNEYELSLMSKRIRRIRSQVGAILKQRKKEQVRRCALWGIEIS